MIGDERSFVHLYYLLTESVEKSIQTPNSRPIRSPIFTHSLQVNKMMRKRNLFLALGLVISILSMGQESIQLRADDTDFNKAMALFEEKQYTPAQEIFANISGNCEDPHLELCVQSAYYQALCALKLYQPNAEKLVVDFITNNPTSSRVNLAQFELAEYFFERKKYRDALEWFKKVEEGQLSLEDRQGYYFKTGYCHFSNDEFTEARENLEKVNDRNSSFVGPATYYLGHIHYLEKNYNQALEKFEELQDNSNFGPIVPYYITQIYYHQEKYEELLELGPALLDAASSKRAPEIARLIGEAHYNLGNFQDALPYLEMYRAGGGRLVIEDYYQLGFAYYQAEYYDKAVQSFNKITSGKDSLAQNGYYLMGDAYVKLNEKQEAKNAFYAAANLSFDPVIQEDAAFNYAKLSYELGDPYYDPVNALQDFVEAYPKSNKKDQAYELMINYFLSAKNYAKALKSLEEIGIKNYQLEVAYQKIAFYRGIQLYNNGDWNGALKFFDKSQKYKHDNKLLNLSQYWKGEALYRVGDMPGSEQVLRKFQTSSGATRLSVYDQSLYSLAYAQFKQEKFKEAITSFTRFKRTSPEHKYSYDAQLRIADSYFMQNEFLLAIEAYQASLNLGGGDDDYATYQLAVSNGLLDKTDDQIQSFQSFLAKFESSKLRDDAYFELGSAYMNKAAYAKAIETFQALNSEYPNNAYQARALLNIGLMYYNSDQGSQAIDTYQAVVNQYPGTAAAKEAIANARRVYVDLDRVNDYADWVSTIDFVDVSKSSLDSAAFEAAEKVYLSNNCEESRKAFSAYLERYENGLFALQAHFYKAQCAFKAEDYPSALGDFEKVLTYPRNTFTEPSLLRAAQIRYFQKNYGEALNHYTKLEKIAQYPANRYEAQRGAMRCYFKVTNYEKAIEFAKAVKGNEKADAQALQEAELIIAKSAYKTQAYELAMSSFKQVEKLSENENKAEAGYYIAELLYLDKDYKGAREKVFELIETMPDYGFWVSKSLLVLARTYWKEEDYFNAEYTLTRLIGISTNPEIKKDAEHLLEQLKLAKKNLDQGSQDTLQIELNQP